MDTDTLITYVAIAVIAAAVVFSVFAHAFKPSKGPAFTPTYNVLNQHIGNIINMSLTVGLQYGNSSAPIWIIYFLNPYDDANYTLSNVFNSTIMSMIQSGEVNLVIVPNIVSYYSSSRVTQKFLPLYICAYGINKTASLEFLKWFSLKVHENSTLALNITLSNMTSELSGLGVSVNYTSCYGKFNSTVGSYLSFMLNVLSWAYGLQTPSGYVLPNDLVVVGVNRVSNIAVVDENIAGYTPPLSVLISNLMTQKPFYG
ncbi:hypothetical protein [Caldivirga sp.]|uniref:hypothetical protein n=1 Tax=Caldivirga sp. TaxID=2080243 RepID=UPI0025C2D918|nr:hypothetical protein [Caldivirga sp.]